jgi:hypothetical protein
MPAKTERFLFLGVMDAKYPFSGTHPNTLGLTALGFSFFRIFLTDGGVRFGGLRSYPKNLTRIMPA